MLLLLDLHFVAVKTESEHIARGMVMSEMGFEMGSLSTNTLIEVRMKDNANENYGRDDDGTNLLKMFSCAKQKYSIDPPSTNIAQR